MTTTDTDNGILLCTRCHQDVHAGRQQIERAGTRWKVRRTLLPPIRRPRGTQRRAPDVHPVPPLPAPTG